VADPKLRYINSRLSCGSCHLGTGAEAEPEPAGCRFCTIRALPRASGHRHDLKIASMKCMQRSMNGRPLPKNSPQMIAMAAYIRSLQDQQAAGAATSPKVKEPPAFKARTCGGS